MNLFTTFAIISELGQRINLSFSPGNKLLKVGDMDDSLPYKQALFKSNKGQESKKGFSSSISQDEQYGQILELIGIFFIPSQLYTKSTRGRPKS